MSAFGPERTRDIAERAIRSIRRAGHRLLRASVGAGDADLWGDTIRHATVRAGLDLLDGAEELRRQEIRKQLEHGPFLAAFDAGIADL